MIARSRSLDAARGGRETKPECFCVCVRSCAWQYMCACLCSACVCACLCVQMRVHGCAVRVYMPVRASAWKCVRVCLCVQVPVCAVCVCADACVRVLPRASLARTLHGRCVHCGLGVGTPQAEEARVGGTGLQAVPSGVGSGEGQGGGAPCPLCPGIASAPQSSASPRSRSRGGAGASPDMQDAGSAVPQPLTALGNNYSSPPPSRCSFPAQSFDLRAQHEGSLRSSGANHRLPAGSARGAGVALRPALTGLRTSRPNPGGETC